MPRFSRLATGLLAAGFALVSAKTGAQSGATAAAPAVDTLAVIDSLWRDLSSREAPHQKLSQLAEKISGAPPLRQLRRVDSRIDDMIRHKSDPQNWNTVDYWATAAETLDKSSGDCEDAVNLKYRALLAGGFDAAALYVLLVGHPDSTRPHHAVLLANVAPVNAAPDWRVLDNNGATEAARWEKSGWRAFYALGAGGAQPASALGLPPQQRKAPPATRRFDDF